MVFLCNVTLKVEDDYVELAKSLMEKAEAKGIKFLLPEDVVVADKVCNSWGWRLR